MAGQVHRQAGVYWLLNLFGKLQSLALAPFAVRVHLLIGLHDARINHQVLVFLVAEQVLKDFLPRPATAHRLKRLCRLLYLP